jgi:hypothetical protein
LSPVKKKRDLGAGEVAEARRLVASSPANAYAAMPLVGVARLLDIGNRCWGCVRISRATRTLWASTWSSRTCAGSSARPCKPNETPALWAARARSGAGIRQDGPRHRRGHGARHGGAAGRRARRCAGARAGDREPARAAPAGVPGGERRAVERSEELRAAGVDPLSAAAKAAASGADDVGQFALPASAGSAGRSLPRASSAVAHKEAALNVASGASTRAVENAMLPDQAASLRQPVLSPQAAALDAITGALFGQMGDRAEPARPDREQLGYRDLALAPWRRGPRRARRRSPITTRRPRSRRSPRRCSAHRRARRRRRTCSSCRRRRDGRHVGARRGGTRRRARRISPPAAAARISKPRAALARQARTVEQPPVIAVNSRGEAIPADENLHPTDMGTVAGLMQNELARRAAEEARRAAPSTSPSRSASASRGRRTRAGAICARRAPAAARAPRARRDHAGDVQLPRRDSATAPATWRAPAPR